MTNIKILDCTLRDGGYVNSWNFKEKNIKFIINNLVSAGCDYIECGFFKLTEYNKDKSWFRNFGQLESLLPQSSSAKYTLMINFGEVPIETFPECNTEINLRIVFKKDKYIEALAYCKQLIKKGYKIFINPMNTNTYSSSELLELIEFVNKLKPVGFTIVDTTGAMSKHDIMSIYYLVDNNLDKNIALCFHSHNNLQLSFSNAQLLMEQNTKRDLIIDSTVFGMGRGAGNLCTELLLKYINDNYDGKYNLIPILKIIDEEINKIFAVTPWGYSVPYYMAATNHCHPNYARYLVDKQTVPVEIINDILETLPNEKRTTYDENFIKQVYLDKFHSKIDDSNTLKFIKDAIKDKTILILAPGKSITTQKAEIDDFIREQDPFIFSLNFLPSNYKIDLAFITNMKRFFSLDKTSIPIIISSNISASGDNIKIVNYSSYLNDSKMFDNVALMLLKLLIKINVKKVYFAGMDGFSSVPIEDYFAENLVSFAKVSANDNYNEIMKDVFLKFSKNIDIKFITKSLYGENK